ncbi:MAG: pyridoxal phosphate-dependent aminotransferase [Betaproteobacteria bacterium]|nr:MAG: pyridoxal phosphate-dependent aminotransferase [Betaproteobacteria bacterium]
MGSDPIKTIPPNHLTARDAVLHLRGSKIREVANASLGKSDVLAFWFGEPDELTPEFIRRAGVDSLAAGETFYTHNYGIAELRAALAAYLSGLHRPVAVEEIIVTASGMSALMLATQALVGHGDRVVEVTPLWPNLVEIPKVLGAHVECLPLDFSPAGWTLDLDRLLSALTPGTRALYINAPNNPTGWTITREEQKQILDHCRRLGIWIIADDAYDRMWFGVGRAAPAFLDIAEKDDRLVTTNTFSKSWSMTGWRIGWLVAPPELAVQVGKLIEYNTSCVPVFVQRAGLAALQSGEPVIRRTVERYRRARDFLIPKLNAIPGVEAALPAGAIYAFFRVEGMTDSLAFCKKLVVDAGLGLAPGAAFGPEGVGFVRWCFASSEERLADGIERLAQALGAQR